MVINLRLQCGLNFKTTITAADYDSNVYNTVQIGTQIWMAENLKTTKYNDETTISLVTDETEWDNLTTPGYCCYNNDETTYKDTYGALYNWYTVNDGNVCLLGLHVPSDLEWNTFISYLGGVDVAGGKIKETGTVYWASPNTVATNETCFNGRPGGVRFSVTSLSFLNKGFEGAWHSSTQASSTQAKYIVAGNDNVMLMNNISIDKGAGFSIPCIKD